jgi:ATP-dependent exoDNAse (exonuclease V) beta subunit
VQSITERAAELALERASAKAAEPSVVSSPPAAANATPEPSAPEWSLGASRAPIEPPSAPAAPSPEAAQLALGDLLGPIALSPPQAAQGGAPETQPSGGRVVAAPESLAGASVVAAADATALAQSTPTPSTRAALADPEAVEVIDLGVERWSRPSGARFGTLVHALLAAVELDGAANATDTLQPLARALGRELDATAAEIERAVADVRLALAHEFFTRIRAAAVRGELHRETSVTLRTAQGLVLDGVVDLVFEEPSDSGPRLCLVDFKTDVAIGDLTRYAEQLALYASALHQALGLPVQSVLFRV